VDIYYVDDGFEKYLVYAESAEDAVATLELSEAEVAKVRKRGRDLVEWASSFMSRPTEADLWNLKDFVEGKSIYVCLE